MMIFNLKYSKAFAVIVLLFCGLFFCSCKTTSLIQEKDGYGRINKLIYYDKNKVLHINEISYYNKSEQQKQVIYKKTIGSEMTTYCIKKIKYNGKRPVLETFYKVAKGKKRKVGEKKIFYNSRIILRTEYYSYKTAYHKTGLDYFLYNSNFKKLLSRRIIKYKFIPKTRKTQQYEHYHIKYNKNLPIPVSMTYRYIVQTKKGIQTKDKIWKKYHIIKKQIQKVIADLTSSVCGT